MSTVRTNDLDWSRKSVRLSEAAAKIQRDANTAGVGPKSPPDSRRDRSWLERFDEAIVSTPLRTASRRLFADGHYPQAVEEAYKYLNNAVKEKSGLKSADGDALMRTVFSAKGPILKLSDLESQSKRDEQRGYMDLYAGAMTGIRNPRAHEHELADDPAAALEMLTIAHHLLRKLESSKKSRRRRSA